MTDAIGEKERCCNATGKDGSCKNSLLPQRETLERLTNLSSLMSNHSRQTKAGAQIEKAGEKCRRHLPYDGFAGDRRNAEQGCGENS